MVKGWRKRTPEAQAEVRRLSKQKYDATEKAKAARLTYRRSEHGRWVVRTWERAQRSTAKGRALRRAVSRRHYHKDIERALNYAAARRFKVSLEEAARLRNVATCEACGQTLTPGKERTSASRHIDHDHVTGKVRGVLCARCNTTLGRVEDSPELLDALRVYLLRRTQ